MWRSTSVLRMRRARRMARSQPFVKQANAVYLLGGRYRGTNNWFRGVGPGGEVRADFTVMIAELKGMVDGGLVPWPVLVTVLAVYLPWVEIAAGLAVLCRRLYLGGLVAIAGLMIVFTAALGRAWARGLDISCGCFGNGEAMIREHFPSLLARDLGLLAGVGVLLVAEGRRVRGGADPKGTNPRAI